MNHNSKPLSELYKKWREHEKLCRRIAAENTPMHPNIAERWKQAAAERSACAHELQAWLREADSEEMPDWFEKAILKLFPDTMYRLGTALWRKIRRNLLGTTRTEGEKR